MFAITHSFSSITDDTIDHIDIAYPYSPASLQILRSIYYFPTVFSQTRALTTMHIYAVCHAMPCHVSHRRPSTRSIEEAIKTISSDAYNACTYVCRSCDSSTDWTDYLMRYIPPSHASLCVAMAMLCNHHNPVPNRNCPRGPRSCMTGTDLGLQAGWAYIYLSV